ncbi:MAG TPA: porin family protein [Burkholderiaceae bacterium]|nr:porin family protein [Burkholderiaceae bacterium]
MTILQHNFNELADPMEGGLPAVIRMARTDWAVIAERMKVFIVKKFLVAAALAASISAPAFAQDKTPFSGPYVAGMLGYERVELDANGIGSAHKDGLTYGGIIGYDINLRGAVFGIEGEYADSETKYSANNLVTQGDNVRLSTDRDLYAGVRIGGEVLSNVMLYAKGGYTNAKAKVRYDDGADVFTSSHKREGYRLGAGVETTMNGVLGRVEYRYSNYGKYEGVDAERHQVALIVGYRF